MLNNSSNRKIFRSTLVGFIFGIVLVLATFSNALFPGLAIALTFPAFFFLREYYFEKYNSDATISTKATQYSETKKNNVLENSLWRKRKLNNSDDKWKPSERVEVMAVERLTDDIQPLSYRSNILTVDELQKIKKEVEKSPFLISQNFHKNLQEYEDFFEKKDPLTGNTMRDLKCPLTIEGIKQNMRFSISTEKTFLKDVLYEKKKEVYHPLKTFLCEKSTIVVKCYDGYPKKLLLISLFARNLSSNENKLKDIPEKSKNNSAPSYDPMTFALSIGV